MLDLTWEWIAVDKAALDVANTVAVEKGVEHDLVTDADEYHRWAEAAARSPELALDVAEAIGRAKPHLLELREHIRAVFRAKAASEPLPRASVVALNDASRAAPEWTEIGTNGELERHTHGTALKRILADYARSAMAIAADNEAQLRVCGAPSCGMFYRPRRRQQRWCSEPCGNRARFARHYAARRR